ncbi:MAG TPA: DMT family transporter [Candidatus Dormibacteraeota bacterium]|nr:DMT family transporter [Candidatus Dormibacteraeota bacterium]
MTSIVVLVLALAAVGSGGIFARVALDGAGPLAVAAWRLIIASLALAGPGLLRPVRVETRDRARLALAGVALAVHFALWIGSIEYVSVVTSTLLVSTTPVWTGLYGAITGVDRPPRSFWGWLSAGGAGVWLVVRSDRTPVPAAGHEVLGWLMALGGAMAIGAYFLIVRPIRSRLDARAVVTWTYPAAAATMILALAVSHQPAWGFTRAAWLGIVGMALIPQLLGHTGLNVSLRHFSASTISFSTLSEPAIAAVLAVIFLHDPLTLGQVAGGVALILALAMVLRGESRQTAPVASP